MLLTSNGIKPEVSKEFAQIMSIGRLGQAKRIKIGKKLYNDDLYCAHLAGQMNALAHILDTHRENPYQNLDELVGDIHLAFMKLENDYKKKFDPKSDLRRIEDFLQ